MRKISFNILHGGLRVLNKRWSSTLLSKNAYYFSEQNPVLLDKGNLQVRNSQTFELKLFKVDAKNNKINPFSLQIKTDSTLKELSEIFRKQFNLQNIKIYSEEGQVFSQLTPVDSLLNRFFTLVSDQYKIKIEGQFLRPQLDQTKQLWKKQLRQSLQQVEQPVVIQRQIQSYINRVQIWLEAKYGFGNQNMRLKSKQVQDILIQALQDPQCRWSNIRQLEMQWREAYYQLQQLKLKYEQVVKVSSKMARNRMYFDLLLIASNIAFIGGGTYFIYSWDIIQPWAYFISSLAGIYLFRKAAKFRKPFSLGNYRNYLIYETYLEKAAKKVGLDIQQFQNKRKNLQLMQTTLKDYIICKL